MKRLAVIPARGGSTRLRDKNIYPLQGKPLIRWSVETVINSGRFDKVIISTDSDKIWDAVSDLPVDRHLRPQSFATTRATVLDAMIDLMENEPNSYDIFSYFLPTCPLLSTQDIQSGVSMLDEDADFVVSMTEMQDTLQLACLMQGNTVIPVLDNLTSGLTNSKFIQKYYRPNGGFYMGKWGRILEEKNFFRGNVKGVMLPKERSIDINDLYDVFTAESLIPKDAIIAR